MLFYIIAFSVAILGLSSANKPTLPVTSCKRGSDDYSACLKRAFQEAWPRFVAGMPEFDFPSLDPLYYKYGKVVYNSDLIHANVIGSNITVFGFSKTHVFDIRTDFFNDNFYLEIDVILPKLIIQGIINVNGTLGDIFGFVNEGPFNITGDDVRATWDLTGHVVNDTWIVEHFHMLPSVETVKVYFNLFPDKGLNDLAVSFANLYWPLLYYNLIPTMSNVWDPWVAGIANKFFSKVSFSEGFP